MKEEIWKKIPGCSYYEASDMGRIRSLSRMFRYTKKDKIQTKLYYGKILKPSQDEKGYTRNSIYKDDVSRKFKSYRTHTLVALTFLGPRPIGMEVAHLNGDGLDNRLENLKYCTSKENHSHKRVHGTLLMGEQGPGVKLKTVDILDIKNLIERGVTHRVIAKKYGISQGHVSYIRNGKTWKHLLKNDQIQDVIEIYEEARKG